MKLYIYSMCKWEYLQDQMLSATFSIPLAPRESKSGGKEGHLFVGCMFCERILMRRQNQSRFFLSNAVAASY